MTEQELLKQLQDIAEPTAVGWWPPAPGWWVLGILMLGGLIAAAIWFIRRRRANRFRKQALRELGLVRERFERKQNAKDYLEELNALLKRVAITRYGRDQVAHLHGGAWCRFLTEHAPGVDFMTSPGTLLGEGLYRPIRDIPGDALQSLAHDWIRRCR